MKKLILISSFLIGFSAFACENYEYRWADSVTVSPKSFAEEYIRHIPFRGQIDKIKVLRRDNMGIFEIKEAHVRYRNDSERDLWFKRHRDSQRTVLIADVPMRRSNPVEEIYLKLENGSNMLRFYEIQVGKCSNNN